MSTTYSEKLRDPRWQKKRLKILNRDNFTCTLCGDKKTEIHVHHSEYIRGREPWEYENKVLKTLCKHCHQLIEFLKKLKDGYEILVCRKNAYEDDYVEFYIVISRNYTFSNEKEIMVLQVWLQEGIIEIHNKYHKSEIEKLFNLLKEVTL